MKIIAAIASALLLAGCSTSAPMWSRDGANEEAFRSEVLDCQRQARIASAAIDPREISQLSPMTRVFHACMREHGWSFTDVPWKGKPSSAFERDDDVCSQRTHRGPAWFECMQRAGWTKK